MTLHQMLCYAVFLFSPSNVGDSCQSYCKPPLVCSNKKCICWKARQVGNTCVVDCPPHQKLVGQECRRFSRLLETCRADQDCEPALSRCFNGRCVCRENTIKRGDRCVAACPDGTLATQVCEKTVVGDNEFNKYSQSTDTCPAGYHCVTYGKPLVGHCCRLYCPYGSAETSKSCEAGAPIHSRCPILTTHFCHSFESNGVSTKLCCPRPCREPTPFYFKGECLPMSHFHDPCVTDGQCEGGMGLACVRGRCECLCPLHSVPIMTNCYKKSRLGDPCFSDSICPRKAQCQDGRCECSCNYVQRMNNCINPDDPLNIDGFLQGFQKIFGGGGGTKQR
ncbi:unnamed protein product [Soboliphyme baturini]|uniref:EB domain-containing protein n=1 Tax=Soboliphyme baturini TaxID=241478 RepID=A0A183IX56_9BILA|nr:unnamed protein product [Soboliphyme baturini]